MHIINQLDRRVARRTIKTLLEAGYALGVNDGEETTLERCRTAKTVFDAMFSTDEDYLLVYKKNDAGRFHRCGWVRFIYGEYGWDVINDYTMNLDEVLKPVHAYTDKLEARYS